MEQTYNGWTNWETWNFMLWHGDVLQMQLEEYADDTNDNIEHGQVYEMVNGFIDMLLEETDMETGFFSDAVGMAIQKINTHEIAENLLESLEV